MSLWPVGHVQYIQRIDYQELKDLRFGNLTEKSITELVDIFQVMKMLEVLVVIVSVPVASMVAIILVVLEFGESSCGVGANGNT